MSSSLQTLKGDIAELQALLHLICKNLRWQRSRTSEKKGRKEGRKEERSTTTNQKICKNLCRQSRIQKVSEGKKARHYWKEEEEEEEESEELPFFICSIFTNLILERDTHGKKDILPNKVKLLILLCKLLVFLGRSFLQIWLKFCSNDLGKTLGPYGHRHDWLVGCLAWLPYSRERGRKLHAEIPQRLRNFVSNSLCQFWIHFVSLKLSQCIFILHYILVCNTILLGKLSICVFNPLYS